MQEQKRDRYYLINNYFAIITNISYKSIKKTMKEQFDIDVYDIKELSCNEYCKFISSLPNIKTITRCFD